MHVEMCEEAVSTASSATPAPLHCQQGMHSVRILTAAHSWRLGSGAPSTFTGALPLCRQAHTTGRPCLMLGSPHHRLRQRTQQLLRVTYAPFWSPGSLMQSVRSESRAGGVALQGWTGCREGRMQTAPCVPEQALALACHLGSIRPLHAGPCRHCRGRWRSLQGRAAMEACKLQSACPIARCHATRSPRAQHGCLAALPLGWAPVGLQRQLHPIESRSKSTLSTAHTCSVLMCVGVILSCCMLRCQYAWAQGPRHWRPRALHA